MLRSIGGSTGCRQNHVGPNVKSRLLRTLPSPPSAALGFCVTLESAIQYEAAIHQENMFGTGAKPLKARRSRPERAAPVFSPIY